MPRHISIHSMICTHCGKCFYGRNVKNQKKIICKVCKKYKKDHYSVVELYLFLQKLKCYEPGLYQKIKLFEMPVFCNETLCNEEIHLNAMFEISNFYKLELPKFRYTNRILKYLQKNKERLKLRHCRYYEKNYSILLINYQTIPLCYLPYIYIDIINGEKKKYENEVYNYSYYEIIIIDFDKYELDETRKLLKELKLKFNTKTASIQSITYSPI